MSLRAWRGFAVLAAVWICHAPATLGSEKRDFSYKGKVRIDTPIRAIYQTDEGEIPAKDRIRISFYNIETFTDGEGDGPLRTPERREAQTKNAADLIGEIDPDILFLAEIENEHALRLLNNALDRPFPFGWVTAYAREDGREEKLNHALLSRIRPSRVLEMDFGPLQGAGRPPRGVLRAEFQLDNNRPLIVYAVHLKSNYGYRPLNLYKRKHALSIVAADARALQESGAPCELLIVGDFNNDPRAPEFADDWSLEQLRGWYDLWQDIPFPDRVTCPTRRGNPEREFPPVAFDRIYAGGDATNRPWVAASPGVLQRGVDVRNADALPGDGGHISDHYPVWIDLVR
ncbi:MAG: endonuclease/exonuclease/phosphatase family protein [Kiritimatiellae bacterium]|nr:endonuclease/exonuclease/phosphatase family protein [Kiritimatiellia bacterium]MDW8458854.1 endonuclease/exonuclease/phosphatase family protein [Verrucomicrobiota bacterium]